VRLLLHRLGGLEPFRDHRGIRDAYEQATAISAPVLLVHGDRDDVVPVSEAHALADRIATHAPDCALTYLEVSHAGHDLISSTLRRSVIPTVVRYCRAAPPLQLTQPEPPATRKGGESHHAHDHSPAGAAR
jgi:dienelactone hydrolase